MSFTNLDLTGTLNSETYRVLIGHTYKLKKKVALPSSLMFVYANA